MMHSGIYLKIFIMKTLEFFKEILLGPPCCPRMELLSTALGPSMSCAHSSTIPHSFWHPCSRTWGNSQQPDTGIPAIPHVSVPLGWRVLPILATKRATSWFSSRIAFSRKLVLLLWLLPWRN